MVSFWKLGENVKGTALAAGLALWILWATTATAQQASDIVGWTTFPSLSEANRAAQANGMILARASNWETLFVTPELAQIIDEQGFSPRSDWSLRWYDQQGLWEFLRDIFNWDYQGYNFVNDSDFLSQNSIAITIESASSDDDDDTPDTPDTDTDTDTDDDVDV